MGRQETLDNIRDLMGEVPGWLEQLPDDHLERRWADMSWINTDSRLSSRDKKLVAFGAAAALHCEY